MSETPFIFYQIPLEFFTDEFLEDPVMMKLIRYIYKRIRPSSHTESIRNNRMLIHLDLGPREFMFGREKAALECGCSEKQIRTRIETLRASSYLQEIPVLNISKGYFSTVRASSSDQKRASSLEPKRASTFTVYRLMTESFSQIKGQQIPNKKGQQMGQQFGKKKGHKEEGLLESRFKEDHHPDPSSSKVVRMDDDSDGLMNDSFFGEDKTGAKEAEMQHNIKNQTDNQLFTSQIEIYPGAFLTQEDLDACIAMKGSLEAVKHAVEYIQKSPNRKKKITNWPNALATWEIKTEIKTHVKENEKLAEYLSQIYDTFEKGRGFWCRKFHDKKKDQKGIIFESQSAYIQPYFIAIVDLEFKNKALKFIKDNKMQLTKKLA